MTRNAENTLIVRQGMGSFLGLNRGADPQDIPPNKFLDGQNVICSPIMGQARTRDGYSPVVDSLFASPFKIMPGARGKLYTPPNINGGNGGSVDGTEYALNIGAAPNTGLYIDDTHATQRVTFYVYGGTELGITTYSWDFGDGANTSGSSTSVYHDYGAPGAFTTTVSGVGTDGKTYSASCSITIERRVNTVTPPGAAPTAEVLANGQSSVTLEAAGSVTFTWVTKNAADVFLTLRVDGTTTDTSTKVAASGSRTVSVTTAADATIRAVAKDNQKAMDYALALVNDPGTVDATCDIRGRAADDSFDQTDFDAYMQGPIAMKGPGPAMIAWETDGMREARIEGQIVTPNEFGYTTLNVLTDRTFRLDCITEGGEEKSDTVEFTVGDSVAGANRRVVISGQDTAFSGDSVTLTYTIEGEAKTGQWTPMNTTGTVTIAIRSDTVNADSYSQTLTFTDESAKNGAARTLTLRTGNLEGDVIFKATLSDVKDGIVRSSDSIDEHTVNVQTKAHTFDVQVLDTQGSDLPGPLYSTSTAGALFALKLTAKFNGTSTVDTDFAGVVQVLATLSNYGVSGGANQSACIEFTCATPTIDGTPVLMSGDRIPAAAWADGICYVALKVTLPDFTPLYPYGEAFQDFTFDAKEIL